MVLIVLIGTIIMRWLTGKAGPVRGFDICILLGFLWAGLAYFVVHQSFQVVETAGILIIEGVGSYLLARTFIRNRAEFESVMRLFLLVIFLLFPFAIYETITGHPILLAFFNRIGSSFAILDQGKRLGLERVQVVFDHSIPFGAFVSAGFALAFFLLARPGIGLRRIITGCVVCASTLFSVSGGALMALFFQWGLIFWNKVTRRIPHRWLILGLLFVALYLFIDLAATRPPAHVFITYMSFSVESGYNRILIFNYGTDNIWANPFFGIGLGDWARPAWMGDSIDNFWLLIAMRHGLPTFLLFVSGTMWLLFAIGCRPLSSPEMIQARYAYMFAIIGMMLAGITVHYWNALFAFFMFLLGTGAWLTYAPEESGDRASEAKRAKSGIRYSRFPTQRQVLGEVSTYARQKR